MFQKLYFPALLFISILIISFNQLYAQEEEGEIIIISEKVGEVIDSEDNKKYNLFPAIKGFQSGVFLRLPDGNYVLKVTYIEEKTDEERVKRIPQPEIIIKHFKEKIDRFKDEKPPLELKSKRAEFYLGIAPITPAAMIGVSGYSKYGTGLEASLVAAVDHLIISGNFILGLPTSYRIIPFATIGVGTNILKYNEVDFLNFGGGIKIRSTDKLGIRIEYRYFRAEDDASAGIILFGISYFFWTQ